ncbi:MAG: hypothetical protein OXU20_26365, partial [Myxococcales bacterium]|nr:hypothetical protein [Myxococcales bacterium]
AAAAAAADAADAAGEAVAAEVAAAIGEETAAVAGRSPRAAPTHADRVRAAPSACAFLARSQRSSFARA